MQIRRVHAVYFSGTGTTEKTVRRRLDDRNVEFHQVAAAPPCVYIRRDHPLAGCDILTETKLAEYPYVFFEREQGAAAECGEEYRPLPEHRPARTVCVNSLAAMRGVLASTDAYAAGCGLLTEGLSDERVRSIPLKGRGSIRLAACPGGRGPAGAGRGGRGGLYPGAAGPAVRAAGLSGKQLTISGGLDKIVHWYTRCRRQITIDIKE